MTRYEKPFLTFQQQADQLIARGLLADRVALVHCLEQVNYYRLSAYWHPFRRRDLSDPAGRALLNEFREGTRLEIVWRRYTFDRQLRILVMDAIERAEVAIRTRLVYLLSQELGPFAYLEPATFVPEMNHRRLLETLKTSVRNASHEVFIQHYRSKYGQEKWPPLWMLAEVVTFGTLFTMVKCLPKKRQKRLAQVFGVAAPVLVSWLKTLNYVRNLCAHHARLWNRELAVRPVLPRNDPRWRDPIPVPNDRIFGVLTVLRYLMTRISPQSGWTCRLVRLLNRYDEVPLDRMGFPVAWAHCPLWQHCAASRRLGGDSVGG